VFGEPSGSLFIGGHFAGSSVRLLRKSRGYESSLENLGVWSRVLLMAVSQTLRTDEGESGKGTGRGEIMYELWQCITRIVIGSGHTKTEIIVNQPIYELLVELIKKAIK